MFSQPWTRRKPIKIKKKLNTIWTIPEWRCTTILGEFTKVQKKDAIWNSLNAMEGSSIKPDRQQMDKVATPCEADHHFKEETGSVGELSKVCSPIVLKCLYLARTGRPHILRSVNKLARAISKWTRACNKNFFWRFGHVFVDSVHDASIGAQFGQFLLFTKFFEFLLVFTQQFSLCFGISLTNRVSSEKFCQYHHWFQIITRGQFSCTSWVSG